MIIKLEDNFEVKEKETLINFLEEENCSYKIFSNKIVLTGDAEEVKKKLSNCFSELELYTIEEKYKLVNKLLNPESDILKENFDISSDSFPIIVGPCAVENRDQLFTIAEYVKNKGLKFFRAGVYKPRSSPYSFQGLKEEGLKLLDEIKKEFGLLIVTEVMDSSKIETVSEVADILQVGSRNIQNYSLLEALGRSGKPVLLKRGMATSVDEYLLCAEHLAYHGNNNIILCERGIKTFETSTRNTLDLNSVPVIKEKTYLPLIVDPSHGVGISDKVIPLALAGAACGADGLMIEIHNNPEKALSDGKQSLKFEQFDELLSKLSYLLHIYDKIIA